MTIQAYNPYEIINRDASYFVDRLNSINIKSQYLNRQMEALVNNTKKLLSWKNNYGEIDLFYRVVTGTEDLDAINEEGLVLLVEALSSKKSESKLFQMGEALSSEYLRNVGYDLAKPDRHLRKILGRSHLGASESERLSPYEVLRIIFDLARNSGQKAAAIDYILWSYCAKDCANICDTRNPKCDKCCIKERCNYEDKKRA